MGKLCQLSPELWPLIDVILFSYIELIFRGGVSCFPAALLLSSMNANLMRIKLMRINFLSSVNANLMRIKLMPVKLMRIQITSVNAA